MTAVTLVPAPPGVLCPRGWEIFGGYNMFCSDAVVVLYSVVFLFPWQRNHWFGLLFGNHIVDASSLVYLFTIGWCERLSKSPFTLMVCGVSYRPISTGQLHESLVLASTSGLSTQWSGWGPLTHEVYGNLILKRASRLDAFSGYPIRT